MITSEFLRNNSLEELENQYNIYHSKHPNQPLITLNYDHIKSPKYDPIVQECRGLVLQSETFEMVARAFPRFYNLGENVGQQFNFDEFYTQDKEDGSLVLIYYYHGWQINTRGSFGEYELFSGYSWKQAIVEAMGLKNIKDLNYYLDKSVTYVCEYCSVYNRVVREYRTPVVYLLTAYQGEKELDIDWTYSHESNLFSKPILHSFSSFDDIKPFIRKKEETDPSYEGLVVRDIHNNRMKIKSETYLALHYMVSDKKHLFALKTMVPAILSGCDDEMFLYFDHHDVYKNTKDKLSRCYDEISQKWEEVKHITDQKEFAQTIKHYWYSSYLFQMKSGKTLPQVWRNSSQVLINMMKN